MTPLRRELLSLRSERDKFGIGVANREPEVDAEIKRMIAEGLIVWLDRAVVSELRHLCDIYLLTPAGRALCEAEGLNRH